MSYIKTSYLAAFLLSACASESGADDREPASPSNSVTDARTGQPVRLDARASATPRVSDAGATGQGSDASLNRFDAGSLGPDAARPSEQPVRLDAGAGPGVSDTGAPGQVLDGSLITDAGSLEPDAARSNAMVDFAAFDQSIEQSMAAYNLTDAGIATPMLGATAAVVDAERVIHLRGYGAFRADRIHLVASSSKVISSGVLVRLADLGLLDLDAPIARYLPTVWGDTGVGRVSVAQLLSNSSGLPSLPEVTEALTNLLSPYVGSLCQFLPLGTLQDCGATLYATAPPRAPDTEFAYGGSAWQLAGAVAEVVSGKSWSELIEETYVQPCGLSSLGYTNQFAGSARTYPVDFEGDVSKLDVTDNPNIEGGAYTTASDYARILQMMLNGGTCGPTRVLSETGTRRMREDRVAGYGGRTVSPSSILYGEGYGFGWWINPDYVVDPGTYGSFAWLDEKRGIAAVIITEAGNAPGGELALRAKVALDRALDADP